MAPVEALITGALAGALERNRSRFNARFQAAQSLKRGLDPQVFSAHLRTHVAPLVDAVSARHPDRVDAVADALYEVSLELLSHDCIGGSARSPSFTAVWEQLLPRLPDFLAAQPHEVAAALVNAAYNLSQEPSARPDEWIAAMAEHGGACSDVPQLLDAGKVLAWRHGMAHYREAALQILTGLPESLVCGILGASKQQTAGRLLAALANPWCDAARDGPAPGLSIVRRVGGFRGFGGTFTFPPRVQAAGDDLYASDRESSWLILADAYGATLHRTSARLPDLSRDTHADFSISESGMVRRGAMAVPFPMLAGASGWASTRHTLAVTLYHSHYVFLVGEAA